MNPPLKEQFPSGHIPGVLTPTTERLKVGSDVEPPELVNHPKHYNSHPAGIECIDVIEHMSFNVGSAMKYLWRAGLKPGESNERDLSKAIWYIQREIEKHKKAT